MHRPTARRGSARPALIVGIAVLGLATVAWLERADIEAALLARRVSRTVGCYQLAVADERGQPDSGFYPTAVRLSHDKDYSIAPHPEADSGSLFWQLHDHRYWRPDDRGDSLSISFSNGFGGTSMRLTLRRDGELSGSLETHGDVVGVAPCRRAVVGRRVSCDLERATIDSLRRGLTFTQVVGRLEGSCGG